MGGSINSEVDTQQDKERRSSKASFVTHGKQNKA